MDFFIILSPYTYNKHPQNAETTTLSPPPSPPMSPLALSSSDYSSEEEKKEGTGEKEEVLKLDRYAEKLGLQSPRRTRVSLAGRVLISDSPSARGGSQLFSKEKIAYHNSAPPPMYSAHLVLVMIFFTYLLIEPIGTRRKVYMAEETAHGAIRATKAPGMSLATQPLLLAFPVIVVFIIDFSIYGLLCTCSGTCPVLCQMSSLNSHSQKSALFFVGKAASKKMFKTPTSIY